MKIKHLLIVFIGAAFLSSCGRNMNTNAQLKTQIDSLSYAIGANVATSLKKAKVDELNYEAFINGLSDEFDAKEIKIKEEEILPFIQKYFTDLRNKKNIQNLEEGRAFLEENKKKEGVKTTESGLQYEVIKEGAGRSPKATDVVVCNYKGTLIDGTEFDSSEKNGKPAEFQLDRVISGWTEGMQLMKEGAKYKFYIPTELAYGERGVPRINIEPNMPIIFEVELLQVKDAPADKPATKPTKRN